MIRLSHFLYPTRRVPPVVRTARGGPPLLWLAGSAACCAVAVIWVAMSL